MTMRGTAFCLALSLPCGGPAAAAPDPALYPAAQCAALWFGWDDFARASTLLDRRRGDLALAEAWRREALRLTTGPAAMLDAFIADQRPLMAALVEDAILGGRVSADLLDRLLLTCDPAAVQRPDLEALR
jgi:hypothetical protein